MTDAQCGDGICNNDLETPQLCPADCDSPTTCGDFLCSPNETALYCQGDCCPGGTLCEVESDCGDLVDNDSDGATDCQDPGCLGVAPCQFEENVCNDGIDNDGDGATDCADPGCSFACSSGLSCSGSNQLIGLHDRYLPRPIADNSTTSRFLAVTRAGTVVSVAVGFTATHTYVSDLNITLTSPANTTIDLSSGNGADGDNYTNTVLIDSATTSVTTASAPFTGAFQPEQPLSTVASESAEGAWRLDVADTATNDEGELEDFDLAICVAP